MIELTKIDTPARPLIINPAHVASLQPLRRVVPSMVSQTPGATNEQRIGTQIFMVDGTHYNVTDAYEKVRELVMGQRDTQLTPPVSDRPAAVPQSGILTPEQIERMQRTLEARQKLAEDSDSPLQLAEQGITDGSTPQSEVAGLHEALQSNLADDLTQITEEAKPEETKEEEAPAPKRRGRPARAKSDTPAGGDDEQEGSAEEGQS